MLPDIAIESIEVIVEHHAERVLELGHTDVTEVATNGTGDNAKERHTVSDPVGKTNQR